jgi:hypothetical protein
MSQRSLDMLSSHRYRDRVTAGRLVGDGAVIGASFGSVYGLIGDGFSSALGERVAQIKGQGRVGRPLSVCLPARRFSQLLDPTLIHPAVRGLALDGHVLAGTLSSLAFVRAPIRRTVAAERPSQLISWIEGVPHLQSVDPGGLSGIRQLMSYLWRHGVRFPAITSMNTSGEPEIVSRSAAMEFSRAHGLAALLAPTSHLQSAKGSFTILEIGPEGIRAARHGVIPIDVVQRLVEQRIDDSITQRADYSPLNVPPTLLASLDHHATCRAVLLRLNTSLPSKLIRVMARLGLGHPWPSPWSSLLRA